MTTPTPHGAMPESEVRAIMATAGFSDTATTWSGGVEEMRHIIRAAIQQAAGAVPEGWKDRLLHALERAAAVESALRALVDECDNDKVAGWEERMGACIDNANRLLSAPYISASPSPLGREAGKAGSSDHLVPCADGGVKVPLTSKQLVAAARAAQIAFCLDKFGSFEVAFAREIEAVHGIKEAS